MGNPGTGKTSVAVLYASLLHKAGVLSGGNVIIANRGSFLGRWVGTEEKNVNMVLEMGKGNLIMIDEAHTLAGANPNDFSRNVLPMFMTALADENNRDFAVVLCGYEKEMDKLMNTDPGLASRFPNKFVFEDFLPGQLYAIGCGRIKDNGYHLENDAAEKLEKLLLAMYGNRTDGWANAREIATVCEKILIAHADRCVKKRVRGEGLLVITEDDIPEYVPCKINVGVSKIGFNRNK